MDTFSFTSGRVKPFMSLDIYTRIPVLTLLSQPCCP